LEILVPKAPQELKVLVAHKEPTEPQEIKGRQEVRAFKDWEIDTKPPAPQL
jgi:hypothetical protein